MVALEASTAATESTMGSWCRMTAFATAAVAAGIAIAEIGLHKASIGVDMATTKASCIDSMLAVSTAASCIPAGSAEAVAGS